MTRQILKSVFVVGRRGRSTRGRRTYLTVEVYSMGIAGWTGKLRGEVFGADANPRVAVATEGAMGAERVRRGAASN